MAKSTAQRLPPGGTEATAATAAEPESASLKVLREVFESNRPLTYIRSSEEERVAALLRDAAVRVFPAPVPGWTGSLTEGMRRTDTTAARAEPLGARAALDFVAAHEGPGIFHLKDFHAALRNAPEICRRVRDLYEVCFDHGKFVVISSPVRALPNDL